MERTNRSETSSSANVSYTPRLSPNTKKYHSGFGESFKTEIYLLRGAHWMEEGVDSPP
jgi:hypothetical protein